jgi:hypothetical protein
VMCFGMIRDWEHPAFKNMHFSAEAAQFDSSPPGTVRTIQENPDGWSIQLVKHK